MGCEELLVELQRRQAELEDLGVALLVLGSQPEPRAVAEDGARQRGITYPILYDSSTRVTKALGLWSDHMQMPWMGYLVVDKSGRVVASDLHLSEAKGAAPTNITRIIKAVDKAREVDQ